MKSFAQERDTLEGPQEEALKGEKNELNSLYKSLD